MSAWIEISSVIADLPRPDVALYMSAWIEIPRITVSPTTL